MQEIKSDWLSLLKFTFPVAMGYYAAGIAYGILAISNDLPVWLIIGMSVLVYSGAAQYAAIPLFVSGAGFFPIVLGMLFMSLRFIFYTLALHKSLPQQNKLMRYLSTITITDESYALLAIQSETARQRNISKINFICHSHWILATIIGIVLGEKLAGSIPHLTFALPCLFAILAYEMYRHSSRLFPIALAILGFIVAKWLMPQWLILFAILFCIVALLIQYQCRSFTRVTK